MNEAIAIRLDGIDAATSPHARADALSQVLAEEFGFAGDRDTDDDPANVDLIRVFDPRRGPPISLSILYVAAARLLGWTAKVLDVPGHVVVLIGAGRSSLTTMLEVARDPSLPRRVAETLEALGAS